MMLRYWLFVGDYHYPRGGVDDLVRTFDTFEATMEFLLTKYRDSENGPFNNRHMWYHVLDTVQFRVYRASTGWAPLRPMNDN